MIFEEHASLAGLLNVLVACPIELLLLELESYERVKTTFVKFSDEEVDDELKRIAQDKIDGATTLRVLMQFRCFSQIKKVFLYAAISGNLAIVQMLQLVSVNGFLSILGEGR